MRICPECGKREIGPRAAMCEPCGRKAVRAYYLMRGICPECKRNELYNGERMCIECRAKEAERSARRRAGENRERIIEQKKATYRRRYDRRKEAGVCYKCGRRSTKDGHILCELCRIKINTGQRLEIPRSERVNLGLCYFCGSELDREGRSCTKCAERNAETLKYARTRIRKDKHVWSEYNNGLFSKRESVENEV